MRLDYQTSTANSTPIPSNIRPQLKPTYVRKKHLNAQNGRVVRSQSRLPTVTEKRPFYAYSGVSRNFWVVDNYPGKLFWEVGSNEQLKNLLGNNFWKLIAIIKVDVTEVKLVTPWIPQWSRMRKTITFYRTLIFVNF